VGVVKQEGEGCVSKKIPHTHHTPINRQTAIVMNQSGCEDNILEDQQTQLLLLRRNLKLEADKLQSEVMELNNRLKQIKQKYVGRRPEHTRGNYHTKVVPLENRRRELGLRLQEIHKKLRQLPTETGGKWDRVLLEEFMEVARMSLAPEEYQKWLDISNKRTLERMRKLLDEVGESNESRT
jgi:small-conductance mechanosensitive channel